jgi:hypothetical protein
MSSGFEVFRAKWFSAKLRDLLPSAGCTCVVYVGFGLAARRCRYLGTYTWFCGGYGGGLCHQSSRCVFPVF